jgi:hypothetical protein
MYSFANVFPEYIFLQKRGKKNVKKEKNRGGGMCKKGKHEQ